MDFIYLYHELLLVHRSIKCEIEVSIFLWSTPSISQQSKNCPVEIWNLHFQRLSKPRLKVVDVVMRQEDLRLKSEIPRSF